MERDFKQWLALFRTSIANYQYYTYFDKVFSNVDAIKVELNIMNSLIGSKNIENDFDNLLCKYPSILKCIPILIAKREMDIEAIDEEGSFCYNFKKMNYSVEQYKISDYPFMHLLYSQLLVCQRVCLQNTVCLICK